MFLEGDIFHSYQQKNFYCISGLLKLTKTLYFWGFYEPLKGLLIFKGYKVDCVAFSRSIFVTKKVKLGRDYVKPCCTPLLLKTWIQNFWGERSPQERLWIGLKLMHWTFSCRWCIFHFWFYTHLNIKVLKKLIDKPRV